MNQCILIGYVKDEPKIKETSNGNRLTQIHLDVNRPYKNAEGNYDSDTFVVNLWNQMADECVKTIEVGQMLAIRGRLQSNNYERDGEILYRFEVVGEKVSALA